MLSKVCDVIVVGAGPAGISAAIHLHWAGRSVQVVDKAHFPRDKCCGDGLTTLALRELERLQFRPGAVANWFDVDGAVLSGPDRASFRVPLPQNGRYAAVAPRVELDHALVEHARSVGVNVVDRATVVDLTRGGDETVGDAGTVTVAIDHDGETRHVAARYVVAADGAWSKIRKLAGATVEGYRGDWHAFRQYASNVTGRAANELMVWFEPDLLPGYAWAFPLPDNRANIGIGVLRDGKRKVADIADLWRDLLSRPHIVDALGNDFELEGRHMAWPIPARVDGVPLTSGRVLFVGDAAAATDLLTGEGIGQALETGRLAAEAISAHGALEPGAVAVAYERLVQRHLVADHRMSRALGAVLSRTTGAKAALAIVERSGAWGRRNFARWMFEDEPRAIALTPSRWHRRFLGRDGAYAMGYSGGASSLAAKR